MSKSDLRMRLGLREANQKFSKAIQAVKQGKEIVLTERGSRSLLLNRLGLGRTSAPLSVVWKRREFYGRQKKGDRCRT